MQKWLNHTRCVLLRKALGDSYEPGCRANCHGPMSRSTPKARILGQLSTRPGKLPLTWKHRVSRMNSILGFQREPPVQGKSLGDSRWSRTPTIQRNCNFTEKKYAELAGKSSSWMSGSRNQQRETLLLLARRDMRSQRDGKTEFIDSTGRCTFCPMAKCRNEMGKRSSLTDSKLCTTTIDPRSQRDGKTEFIDSRVRRSFLRYASVATRWKNGVH